MLRASLVPGPEIADVADAAVTAFAGIAMPDKFFGMLRAAGVKLASEVPFPDHHPYTEDDILKLMRAAQNAVLVTTPKDAVRVPSSFRPKIHVISVSLAWEEPAALEALLDRLL